MIDVCCVICVSGALVSCPPTNHQHYHLSIIDGSRGEWMAVFEWGSSKSLCCIPVFMKDSTDDTPAKAKMKPETPRGGDSTIYHV